MKILHKELYLILNLECFFRNSEILELLKHKIQQKESKILKAIKYM